MKQTTLDPVSLEILWAKLVAMVDEAAATFRRTSFSTLVRDANDFAVVLTDAEGRSVAQSSMSIPSFIGTLPATVRHILKRFAPEDINDGDIIITNDPWDGTGHVHDATIVKPIFVDGKLTGFAAIATHLPDIGGRIRTPANRDIYEEGLQIPLVKLVRAGVPNETMIEIIERNVRIPERTMGDFWAAISGCETLAVKLKEFLREGGAELSLVAQEVQARSETAMRDAIRAVPDGHYRRVVQHDGFEAPITIVCTVIVKDDEIIVDYEGSAPQLPRAINVVPIYTFAYTAYAIKTVLCPDVPNNEGSFAPITTRAPEGSILNPVYPAPTGARALVGHLLPPAVMGALAEAMPDRVWAEGSANGSINMAGSHQGRPYAVVNFINAGQGASAARAGLSALSFPSNLGNTPIEVMESLAPIRVIKRGLRRRSGGPGKHRGGDGIAFSFQFLGDTPAICSFLLSRMIVAPGGLMGGEAGRVASLRINGRKTDPRDHQELHHGDIVEVLTAGGGGFGAAQTRL